MTLAAHQVSVDVGRVRLLDAVTLAVNARELLAVVGPNGAGKSTLLGCLAGDRAPSSGTVELDGRTLCDWPARDLARRRAVLLQDVTVSFPFTVRQVVEMGRAPWSSSIGPGASHDPDRDEQLVAQAMVDTDVDHLAGRAVPSLSGGERARVALARVLAQDTDVLLLDEPTAALDIHHQERVLELLAARAHEGAAVVVVLHDLGAAAAFADRIAVLQAGRIVELGAPRDVMRSDLLTRVYGHQVDVVDHPEDGSLLVSPRRRAVVRLA